MKFGRDFYEVCYDQYKAEVEYSETLIQRGNVLLTAQALTVGIAAYLYNSETLPRASEEFDVLLYHIFVVVTWITIMTSIGLTAASMYPRKYQTLASLKKWELWHTDQISAIADPSSEKGIPEIESDTEFLSSIIPILTSSQHANSKINEARRKLYQWAFLVLALAFVPLSIQFSLGIAIVLGDVQ